MTTLGTLAGEYAGNLLKILLTWFLTVMTLTGATFDQLITQKALVALSLAIVAWLAQCVISWQQTGKLDPVPAAFIHAANVRVGFADAVDTAFEEFHRGEAGPQPVTAFGQGERPPDVPAPPSA